MRLHLCGCMRGTVYSIGGLVVWLASGSALAAQTHTPTLSFSANAGVRSTAMPRGIADRFLFGGFIDSTEVTQWIDRTHEAPGGWMRAGGIARAELEFDSGKRWAVRANGWSIVDVQATAGAVEAAMRGTAAGRALDLGGTAARGIALNSVGVVVRNPWGLDACRLEVAAVQRWAYGAAVVEEGVVGLSAAADTLTARLLGYGGVDARDAWGLAVGFEWTKAGDRSVVHVRVRNVGAVLAPPGRVEWSADTALVTSGFSLEELRSEGFAQRWYRADTAKWRLEALPAGAELSGYTMWARRMWAMGSVWWGDWMPTPQAAVSVGRTGNRWSVGMGVGAGGWGGWRTRAGYRGLVTGSYAMKSGLTIGVLAEDVRGWWRADGAGRGVQVVAVVPVGGR